MLQFKYEDYFKHLNTPDTWNNLGEFIIWYMEAKMPMRIPINAPVYKTDTAVSVVIFRHDRYQVELYLNDPLTHAEYHGHPGINILSIMPISDPSRLLWGTAQTPLREGSVHDGHFNSETGTVFLTFEEWAKDIPIKSASVNWNGKTVGPLMDELIKREYPKAKVIDGVSYLTKEDLLDWYKDT